MKNNKILILISVLILLPLLALYQIVGYDSEGDNQNLFETIDQTESVSARKDILSPGSVDDNGNTIYLHRREGRIGKTYNNFIVAFERILHFDFKRKVRYFQRNEYEIADVKDVSIDEIIVALSNVARQRRLERRLDPGALFDILDVYNLLDDDLKVSFKELPVDYVEQMYLAMLYYWRDVKLKHSRELLKVMQAHVSVKYFRYYLKSYIKPSLTAYKHLPVRDIVSQYRLSKKNIKK